MKMRSVLTVLALALAGAAWGGDNYWYGGVSTDAADADNWYNLGTKATGTYDPTGAAIILHTDVASHSGSYTVDFGTNRLAASWGYVKDTTTGLTQPSVIWKGTSGGIDFTGSDFYVSAGKFEIQGGSYSTKNELRIGWDAAATFALSNATFVSGANTVVKNGAVTTVGEGGVLSCGTATTAKWLVFESGADTVNLEKGSTLAIWHANVTSGATGSINMNGGTVQCLGVDANYNKWLFGNTDANTGNLTVTVNAAGGTIDVNGKAVVVNSVIGGTGTLTVTNTSATAGSIAFSVKPTCAVRAAGNILMNLAVGATPAALTLGAGDFVQYDLSGVTADATTTNLAENVTISVPEGDSVARHVIIKNSNGVYWNVAYDATAKTLTATSFAASAYTTEATGDFTIFTGYKDNGWPINDVRCWVNGFPTSTTAVIVPATTPTMGIWSHNVVCGELVMNGDLTVSGHGQYLNFRPQSIGGTGTFTFTADQDAYGYFEAYNPKDGVCAINVPAVLGGGARVSSKANQQLTFNKVVTIAEGAEVTENSDLVSVFNDDLIVNGTYKSSWNTTLRDVSLKSGKTFSGKGTLSGNLDLSAGAILGATITNANGAAAYVTVTGTANLQNATVSVAGGELVADAARGTEITLLKASTISNWTKQKVTIGGEDWTVKQFTVKVDDSTTYDVLKATRVDGLTIIIR